MRRRRRKRKKWVLRDPLCVQEMDQVYNLYIVEAWMQRGDVCLFSIINTVDLKEKR